MIGRPQNTSWPPDALICKDAGRINGAEGWCGNVDDRKLDMPQSIFEETVRNSAELDQPGTELLFRYVDLDGPHEFTTCYGDVVKTINALMDYTKLLEMVCDQWGLNGFHRGTYEYHAEKLREISGKFQSAIGYDYVATLEKCRKKRAKKRVDDGVGEDAMVLAFRANTQPNAEDADAGEDSAAPLSPWADEN